jgi:hypothetical protein
MENKSCPICDKEFKQKIILQIDEQEKMGVRELIWLI